MKELIEYLERKIELCIEMNMPLEKFAYTDALRKARALQLQQTGVKQSVCYSIVDNDSVLEKFKEKETAEYALEEYKRMGFPYATISETVAAN